MHKTIESLSDLAPPLAIGNTAEVYAWEQGWVLKLFFERYGADIVAFEQRMAAAVAATDLPVPAVGEQITVGNRLGLLYERCEGQPMGEAIMKQPWRLKPYARHLAQLHAQLHTVSLSADLPLLHEKLRRKIDVAEPLSHELRRAALDALSQMPIGSQICHGDFHPGNLLLSRPLPTIIDWVDGAIGNPLADVARSSILLQGVAEVEVPSFLRGFIRRFHATYLRHYFELRPDGYAEYQAWLPIVAAARLEENVSGWNDWLLEQAHKQ